MLTSQNMATLTEIGPAETASETVRQVVKQFSRAYLQKKENYYQECLVVNSQHGSKTTSYFSDPAVVVWTHSFPVDGGIISIMKAGLTYSYLVYGFFFLFFLFLSLLIFSNNRVSYDHTHTHFHTHTNSKWFVKVIHGSNPPKLTPHHPTGLKTHDFGTRPPLSGSVSSSHTGQNNKK